MNEILERLYKITLALIGTLFIGAGVALMVVGYNVHTGFWSHVPIADAGATLFTTGWLTIALQYFTGKYEEKRASDRLLRTLEEGADSLRDAVIHAFAFSPETLQGVISPQILERVVQNCLAIQLEDRSLADQQYAELIQTALTPAARYSESRLTISLTATQRADVLLATVRREYRFVPAQRVLRFHCVGSRDEYDQLLRDPETTEVWHVGPSYGLTTAEDNLFTVNGVELDGELIDTRRVTRKDGVTFTARLPLDAGDAETRHLSYEYAVLVPRDMHSLHFDFGRPTKGLTVELSYDDSARLPQLLDYLGTTNDIRRAKRTSPNGGGEATVSVDGWVLPHAGIVLTWR